MPTNWKLPFAALYLQKISIWLVFKDNDLVYAFLNWNDLVYVTKQMFARISGVGSVFKFSFTSEYALLI